MNDSLPYKVKYSIGDKKCKKCRIRIRSGLLQIAIMMQSDLDDRHDPVWYHQNCFFKTRLPPTEAAFDGFFLLRYDDQLAMKECLGLDGYDTEIISTTTDLLDFSIEYAKSTQSVCVQGCNNDFKNGDLLLRVSSFSDENQNFNVSDNEKCYDLACFTRLRSEIGWLKSGEMLRGFNNLSAKDKQLVKSNIPMIKHCAEATKSGNYNEMKELEAQIRTQNIKYFQMFDQIAKVSEDDRIDILKANKQFIPETDILIQHHLTDVIYFGALKKCEKCPRGKLIFNNWIYKCTYASGWLTCDNEVMEPKRIKAKIPAKIVQKYAFLQCDLSVRIRVLPAFRMIDEHGNDLVYGPYKKPLLFNMEFVLVGKMTKPRKEIEKMIKRWGGRVVPAVHDKIAAVISTKIAYQRMETEIKLAKEYNIQIISEDFLNHIPNEDPIQYIKEKCLCDWGNDPLSRIEENDVVTRRETILYNKSVPVKVTYKLNKDGTDVDSDCGLEKKSHVYCKKINNKDVYYSVILGLVDIENNKNSYFRMQLLESNRVRSYWVFESWGRISTVIGSNRLTSYKTLDEALDRFHSMYMEKTGNKFASKLWHKMPNKYFHIDIDVTIANRIPSTLVPSKLEKPLYELMEMLFDIRRMENIMCGCDLDLKQMPLGKISRKQIESAMTTLQHIARLIERNGTQSQLRDASNKFYTLIPHAFSIKRPPVIDTINVVNAKNEMLESLLSMETIYGYLEGENGDKINPLDACYPKLNAKIIPLDKNSRDYATLCCIVRNTVGPTHRKYCLEVLDIFQVEREGEDQRFQRQYGNHQLLWHGSRLMNYVSILSNGLKIAPPEATHSGYMFGKGIYFADVVTKSTNYCYTDPFNNTGLALLCEVALGNFRSKNLAEKINNIPNDVFQSVKGNGLIQPDRHIFFNGTRIAAGGLKSRQFSTSLYYNEYVVYDPAQIKVKYLFKLKFNYPENLN